MNYEIRYSGIFLREAKTLSKKYASLKDDLKIFVAELAKTPDMGTPLGNNLFKIRISITSKGRGKSGGARIITCIVYKHEQVLLAEI